MNYLHTKPWNEFSRHPPRCNHEKPRRVQHPRDVHVLVPVRPKRNSVTVQTSVPFRKMSGADVAQGTDGRNAQPGNTPGRARRSAGEGRGRDGTHDRGINKSCESNDLLHTSSWIDRNGFIATAIGSFFHPILTGRLDRGGCYCTKRALRGKF